MGISPKDFASLQDRLAGRRRSRSEAASSPPPVPVFRRILGLDPSLRGTGLGVVEFGGPQPVAILQQTIRCPPSWPRTRCLGHIGAAVSEVLREASPDLCVVEGLFFAQNLKTAITLGEARGAALSRVAEAGLPVFEIAPRKVKLAIVGFGAAQKIAVAKMVQRMLALPEPPEADAADALALALAFAQESRGAARRPRQPL
ncbi:MAG: crossover junction endodeoxyribonuclease RuvC [Verrucomicrobiae bacterium]|nr:crossover junction endodeoxyribonuclease RuvC [Verrucomicrobiae bacterium]